MRLYASRATFIRAYLCQNQEAFLEGHRFAFELFGGVPERVIYDNLKTAVKKVLEGTKRTEQEAFTALRYHYAFAADSCNVRQAHEKGRVENGAGFAKRNFLVPLPQVSCLEELNEFLIGKCLEYAREHKVPGTEKTVAEAWEEEKKALLSLPAKPFACCRVVEVKSDCYSRVCFETNRYSVPVTCAGLLLHLRAHVDRIEIWQGRECIASHKRSYDRGEEILDPMHYLLALTRKPRPGRTPGP